MSTTVAHLDPSKIIDGKLIATKQLVEIKNTLIKEKIKPGLAVILVGNDPASHTYVKNKIQACEQVGIKSSCFKLDENINQKDVIKLIQTLNKDKEIHGILVQLPLPNHLITNEICDTISLAKDVDGLSAATLGKIITVDSQRILPCTPRGIMFLLKCMAVNIVGQHCVIVGASAIVGKPLALELINEGATVTVCHKETVNLENHIQKADILISAIGKPGVIKTSWLQENCIAIDIGITKVNGRIKGDLEFESAITKVSKITPVPGGVGPITVAMLMQNTLEAYLYQT